MSCFFLAFGSVIGHVESGVRELEIERSGSEGLFRGLDGIWQTAAVGLKIQGLHPRKSLLDLKKPCFKILVSRYEVAISQAWLKERRSCVSNSFSPSVAVSAAR